MLLHIVWNIFKSNLLKRCGTHVLFLFLLKFFFFLENEFNYCKCLHYFQRLPKDIKWSTQRDVWRESLNGSRSIFKWLVVWLLVSPWSRYFFFFLMAKNWIIALLTRSFNYGQIVVDILSKSSLPQTFRCWLIIPNICLRLCLERRKGI